MLPWRNGRRKGLYLTYLYIILYNHNIAHRRIDIVRRNIDEQKFREVCQNSKSAAEASRRLNMHFNTFKRIAIKLGCYTTNQSHKGVKMGMRPSRIPTDDILAGKYPNYGTFKLKRRLIREGYKKDECEKCGWHIKREGEEFSPCELHHIDGDSRNHKIDNLIILCPNCHSLTQNYRARNKKSDTVDINF